MKNLLYGNGVTIQFGGKNYFNDRIIKRAINNINIKKFPSEIYPKEIKLWVQLLCDQVPLIISGEYDLYTNTNDMKASLEDFKERYKNRKMPLKVHEIGLEDYFLINFLLCHKEKIINPEKFNYTQTLRCFFIDSIYNQGKIQLIYKNFPVEFIEFLKLFDNIFTTNYDWNIEKVTNKEVNYLHGCFHVLDSVYDPNSLRNKMADSPIKNNPPLPEFTHLYSNALTSYSGGNKKFILESNINANIAVEKFVKGMKEKPELRKQIEEWKVSGDKILENMYDSIMLKEKDETLRFGENVSLKNMDNIEGAITILGLSPYNDTHIFEQINNNIKLTTIEYYYFSEHEAETVKGLFNKKEIVLKDVKEFWKEF
ncbi:hypothetical protein [Niallia circulans]|uniref:Uncharacterized protein n=1 Tax=Niallia circulans TaxID=1397 RepID=A0A941GIC3_NIACI|nr:hypothetical protein [Niallia circulans]MCB5235496.1 hypothetical protein [Niallia circulans]